MTSASEDIPLADTPDAVPPPLPEFDDDFEDEYDEALPRKGQSSATLALWIVVVVLGLLFVGGLLTVLIGPSVWDTALERQVSAAELQMWDFGLAIDNYRLTYKKLPASLEGLTETSERNSQPYMKAIPHDPWGNPYEYLVLNRTTYRIRCNGEDGIPDTGDDIVWPPEDW